jgi:serralysin
VIFVDSGGFHWDASMVTENFAKSGTSVFVTGVVYSDFDHNDFYTIGEGVCGNFCGRHGGGKLGV